MFSENRCPLFGIMLKEAFMRVLIFVASLATAVLLDVRAGHAWYGNGPWCAVESIGFGTVSEDCSVRSFEECRMLTIAGNVAFRVAERRASDVQRLPG